MPIFSKYSDSTEFLDLLRPAGPHLLTAIPVGGGHLVTKLFPTTEGVVEWAQATNTGHGIYYHVAIPKDGVSQRLSKDKVGAVDHLWVDVDPPGGGTREAILDRLTSLQPSLPALPNYVVDSGGGFQALWKLSAPVTDLVSVERATRFLVDAFRGDRQAWNVDRLLRLPGTINYPNARKAKQGREPCLTDFTLLHSDATPFEKFPLAPPLEITGEGPEIHIDGPVRTYTPDNLPDELGEKWKDIVTHCHESWHFKDMDYASRSEAVIGAVRYMLESHLNEQVIYDILLSRELRISEHIYDQQNVHRYAKRQISQAKKGMSATLASSEARVAELSFITSDPPMKDGKPQGNPKIISTLIHNAIVAAHKLGVKCAYNVMSDIMEVNGEPFEDHIITNVRTDAEERFKVTFKHDLVKQVLQSLCKKNPYNPVEDYLNSLPEWDKTPRVDSWLTDYFGVDNTELNRAISRIILVAAVRRVRAPGCKFDEMLILEGAQGDGKSMLLGALMPEPSWFNDHLTLDKGPKEFMEDTCGHWIIECSELVSMRRAQVEQLKAILSRQVDRARMAYARSRSDRPRMFIIVGSTNQENYLVDDTGNRRFWPMKTSGCLWKRVPRLKAIRDQLWAEASELEAAGESIRLHPRFYPEAAAAQKVRQVENVYFDSVEKAVGDADGVVRLSAMLDHLNVPLRERTSMQYKVAAALREQGFEKTVLKKDGRMCKVWKRGDSTENITFHFDAAEKDHC